MTLSVLNLSFNHKNIQLSIQPIHRVRMHFLELLCNSADPKALPHGLHCLIRPGLEGDISHTTLQIQG